MSTLPQKMRVAIAYNQVEASGSLDERDVLNQAAAVSMALSELGHEPVAMPCDLNLSAFKRKIKTANPDVAFNLVESLDGHGRLISVIPSLLDALGIPYTGAPACVMHETSHKILAKERMHGSDLPTPAWIGPWPIESCTQITLPAGNIWDRGPWIIKSLWEHASIGIGKDALVLADKPEDLMGLLRLRTPQLGGACFSERYVDGREFNLSLLGGPDGPMALPCAEIVFENFANDQPRIVCYKAKWDETSFEYTHTRRRFDFPQTDGVLLEMLRKTALKCWHVFGLRGYARVDFRVDAENRPWVLEVNANPCLSEDAGFAAAVERAGMTFTQAVDRILADAMVEAQRPFTATVQKNTTHSALPDPKPVDTIFSYYHRSGQCTLRERGFSPPEMGGRKAPCNGRNNDQGPDFRYAPCPQDIRDIRALVEATGFFHPYEVAVAVELVEDRLAKGDASDYHFVFIEQNGRLAGYVCFGPIPCTIHSFDMYWIAVHPDFQNQGLGRILNDETERLASQMGGQRIYIETSQSAAYDPTRAFYQRCGYRFEAVLEDFYAPGDGKVIGCKALQNPCRPAGCVIMS